MEVRFIGMVKRLWSRAVASGAIYSFAGSLLFGVVGAVAVTGRGSFYVVTAADRFAGRGGTSRFGDGHLTGFGVLFLCIAAGLLLVGLVGMRRNRGR